GLFSLCFPVRSPLTACNHIPRTLDTARAVSLDVGTLIDKTQAKCWLQGGTISQSLLALSRRSLGMELIRVSILPLRPRDARPFRQPNTMSKDRHQTQM